MLAFRPPRSMVSIGSTLLQLLGPMLEQETRVLLGPRHGGREGPDADALDARQRFGQALGMLLENLRSRPLGAFLTGPGRPCGRPADEDAPSPVPSLRHRNFRQHHRLTPSPT